MAKRKLEPITDDLAVDKEAIDRCFNPKIARSTFYKKVDAGTIVKCREVSGYYMLNQTRQNLGLPLLNIQEYQLSHSRQVEVSMPKRLALMAMMALIPELQDIYPHSLLPEWLSTDEKDQVLDLVKVFEEKMESDKMSLLEKIFFAGGAVRAEDIHHKY